MPFVQRIIEPKYLSRTSLHNEDGEAIISDYELEAVTNNTLSNALRQLASLVLVANDIFTDLTKELQKVSTRSSELKIKIGDVEKKVSEYDPKQIAVPEGDLSAFALRTIHYVSKQNVETGLFTSQTRPEALRQLYEAAAKTPVHVMRQMDRWRRDGHRSSRFFLCTPVLGRKKKIKTKIDIDIETRMPASVEELRRWTSTEALGDVTVTTDCINRIAPNNTTTIETDMTDTGATSGDDEGIDHKLPSPEEQLQVIALKFPAEIVAVDVSGRRFDRMTTQRRSLLHSQVTYATEEEAENNTIRRRSRTRKPRGKRRNTLAGTDQKEIVDALTARDEPSSSINGEQESPDSTPVIRSKSSDLLRSSKKVSPPDVKKSHFNSLKQWGLNKLKNINLNKSSEKTEDTSKSEDIDDINIYETVSRRWKNSDKNSKTHERKTSYSSSEKSSSISLPISTPVPPVLNTVKLRDSSAQMRQRRNGQGKEEQHSSSGNWSASSESGRASIGSEITSTTTHPKSTTSAATSSNSLNQHIPGSVNSRRRFINTSASSSVTSEGTLTPDIIHDDETSSVYSCDTEGYYTSFHMDSGLKTLKEEDSSLPATPLHSTTAFSNSNNCTILSAENEYELFGKGSTSTTTSSAGTVCTTLMAAESSKSLSIGPVVPERKSSLSCNTSRSPSSSLERDFGSDKTGTVKRSPADNNKETVTALVHNNENDNGDVSPDSGHNTSSSPIESVSSPNGAPSGSEFEFSESSDLEGVDRIERIRIKTTINSSRIPSMCVITPCQSDDESVHSECERKNTKEYKKRNGGIPDLGSKNINRDKLNLPIQPTETDLDTLFANEDNKENTSFNKCVKDNSKTDMNKLENMEEKNTNNMNKKNITQTSEYTTPTKETVKTTQIPTKISPQQTVFKATLLPLNNMLGKLKTNFTNLASRKEKSPVKPQNDVIDDALFDSGDYVTIADVRNNNEKASKVTAEIHYANDVVKSPENPRKRETEYVCLQELPISAANDESGSESRSLERKRQGARVTLDAEGKVVYSSDSLKRRKGAHTTFEPGPCVKDLSTQSPLPVHRTPKVIRPVQVQEYGKSQTTSPSLNQQQQSTDSRPLSPQTNKVVIRANPKTSSGVVTPTADCVRMLPATIVTPSIRPMSPKLTSIRGAYVNMQEDRDRSLSPTIEEEHGSYASYNYHPNAMEYHDNRYDYLGQEFMMQRGSAMYSTLPSRRPPRVYQEEAETYRRYSPQPYYQGPPSVDYYGYNSLPRRPISNQIPIQPENYNYQPQNNIQPKVSNVIQNQVPLNTRNTYVNFHSSTPNKDLKNIISKVPMGISNFFSPIKNTQPPINESPKLSPLKISPIEPCNSGKFQSSTPQHKSINSAINLSNKLLSPKKSTMSNEELYAVIHRSKKKLNIKTDFNSESTSPPVETLSPKNNEKQPETGYLTKPQTRSSWSPNNDDKSIDSLKPGSRQSWACNDRLGVKSTSRLDFKKLLLQQNSKSPSILSTGKKMSAVEQLRLAKDQISVKKSSQSPLQIADLSASPRGLTQKKFVNGPSDLPTSPEKQRPQPKIMSPRSAWRFTNPRSDVLSSTILEDCREDETSNELNNSPRNQLYQNSVANSNTVSDASKQNFFSNKFLQNDKVHKPEFNAGQMTRSQYIQARKEAYFNNYPNPNTNSTNNTNPNVLKNNVRASPPTLETAL